MLRARCALRALHALCRAVSRSNARAAPFAMRDARDVRWEREARPRDSVRAVTKLEATLYALTHRGNPGDLAFYRRECRAASSTLELGVGYGRMLPSLARASASVWGIDSDASLLSSARRAVRALPAAIQRRIVLQRGDISNFSLGRSFDRIVLPYNTLYCLLSRRAVLACLRSARKHLAPGGLLVFDIWAADAFHKRAGDAAHRDDTGPILSVDSERTRWDVFESSRLRRRTQRLDVTYTYVPRAGGARVQIDIPQRYARSLELIELLTRAGLAVDTLSGDFSGAPFKASSEHVIVRARAAAPAPSATKGWPRPV
jgi:SAM-dependent methyltransferase